MTPLFRFTLVVLAALAFATFLLVGVSRAT